MPQSFFCEKRMQATTCAKKNFLVDAIRLEAVIEQVLSGSAYTTNINHNQDDDMYLSPNIIYSYWR